MSPVRTSIPKGAHALVEVNGRREARRHNDVVPRRKEIIVWDVQCVPRS